MSNLEIADLSFFEVVDNSTEVKGGNTFSSINDTRATSLLRELLASDFVQYTPQEQLYSDSSVQVNRITNNRGESGVLVSSRDGTYQMATLSGDDTSTSFSSSVVTYSFGDYPI
jgi:hypothetical protein